MSEPGEKSDHEGDHEAVEAAPEVAKLEASPAEPARTEEPAPEPPKVEEPAQAEEPAPELANAEEPVKAEEPPQAEEPAPLPPPELREVGPNQGSRLGGLEVTLRGENFADGVTARFGGVAAEVRFLTGTELSATTPAFVGYGEVDVEVTNPDGVSSVLPAAFTYEPNPTPEIAGVTPAFGPTTGGTCVIIEGKNFAPDATVHVDRVPPKELVVKSDTEIQIVTARCWWTSGVVDVEVAVPGAPSAVMKEGFRYDALPTPAITSVFPTAGTVCGGTELTIIGENFTRESLVLVAGKATRTIELVDGSTLEVRTPPGESGKMADVIVRNADGQEAVQKRAFLYDPRHRG